MRPSLGALRELSGRALCAVVLCVAAVLSSAGEAQAGDPRLAWSTISTPHFRIHYHSGLQPLAERLANIAEHIHADLTPHLGWSPKEPVDIAIDDQEDRANGSAGALPYSAIRLFVSAPDDMSVLGDYDDWQFEILTHEYTHVLHTDNISGFPALLNAILGKTFAPNHAQPSWVLEGLAVAMESQRSQGGRLRSTQFDMFLRADVLEKNLATLDEISNNVRRWPSGNLWYLYGSKFVEYIIDTYGPDTFAQVASDYGKFVVPYGINRSIRRATGRTYPELYAGWKATIERRYAEQAARVASRGLREGRRLTSGGRVASAPRFVPAHCRPGRDAELVYLRDDGDTRPGLYRLPLAHGRESERTLLTRANGSSSSFAPDCSLYFDGFTPTRRRYVFQDLFRLRANQANPAGDDLRRERLTTGERAREPSVSPDGRSISYVTNAAGTTTLRIAELDANGELQNRRRLVPSARFEQAYTPRFSPDGRRVAYGVWTAGGFRDVRVVDVASGAFFELWRDRAIDQQPSWSSDGNTLYFSSDRSGIANVYAYELASGELHQVTNVLTGAYMPEVSPDGRTLVYVGYTSAGFDLFSLPLDRSRWLAPPPPSTRPSGNVQMATRSYPITPYSALPTLRPRAYAIDFGTTTFGDAITLSTQGADIADLHEVRAQVGFELRAPIYAASLDYFYKRLPAQLYVGAFRNVVPRNDYRLGEQRERVDERQLGVTTSLVYYSPGEFDGQLASLGFTLAHLEHDSPVGTRPDPWAEVPYEPFSGTLASLKLGYTFSNTEGSVMGISAERGVVVSAGAEVADPAFGSSEAWSRVSGSVSGYLLNPLAQHHVLALALSGGSSAGRASRGFLAGGFSSQPALEVYTTDIRRNPFVLRGFEAGQFGGAHFVLLNAEYRFPILYVDRGVSTLPVFLQTLSGAVFSDYGGAFDRVDREHPNRVLHLGAGAELWLQLVLGYQVSATLRFGAARGFGADAPGSWQTYFAAANAF